MDNVKEAFNRVKKDTDSLKEELEFIKTNILEDRKKIIELCDILKKINFKIDSLEEKRLKTESKVSSTDNTKNSTTSTHFSTHNIIFKPLNDQNLTISIGNEGVSTDRQTDNSTDRQIQELPSQNKKTIEFDIKKASEILDSLDRLKKEIRLKFKQVTSQEMAVFSTIYQLEEQDSTSVTYKQIAKKLHLSESSIRDYVQRMINKGIPIKKQKINNKKLILSISEDLRKIATLSTIIQLREL